MGRKQDRHLLVQAPVAAVDVDGLAVVTVGTALFALVSIGCLVFHGWLLAHGHDDWTAISISGFALGLIGLAYCWNRRRRRPRSPRDTRVAL
jgi:hypothetical protein